MAASIEVRFSQDPPSPDKQSYDLKVEVLSAIEMPEEIFLLQRHVAPAMEGGGTPQDLFISVADPLDLEEYPAGMDPKFPCYRVSVVVLRFRDQASLLQTKQFIIDDIQGLVDAINGALTNPISEIKVIS
jgi:hypothetical protein